MYPGKFHPAQFLESGGLREGGPQGGHPQPHQEIIQICTFAHTCQWDKATNSWEKKVPKNASFIP